MSSVSVDDGIEPDEKSQRGHGDHGDHGGSKPEMRGDQLLRPWRVCQHFGEPDCARKEEGFLGMNGYTYPWRSDVPKILKA